MIENKTGASVERENFFGREKEITLAWNKIKDGNSLILAAPRRVGKTSFAKKMRDIALNEDWHTFFIDLEGIHTEKEFVATFIDKIESKKNILTKGGSQILDLVKQIKPTISVGGVEMGLEWRKERDDIYRKLTKLIESFENQNILIILDELAIFLGYLLNNTQNGIDDVRYFLNWLRSFRQNNITHRWIFCSSVSIENFLSLQRLSHTMNDVEAFKLGELIPSEAMGLLNALSQSYHLNLPDEAQAHLLRKIGWALPFYIQIIFSELYILNAYNTRNVVSIENIEEAYEHLLSKQYFNTWEERLREYGALSRPMKQVLDKLSETAEGASRDVLITTLLRSLNNDEEANDTLSKILSILKNDGYIDRNRETNKYLFRSFLLRDFWYNKFMA